MINSLLKQDSPEKLLTSFQNYANYIEPLLEANQNYLKMLEKKELNRLEKTRKEGVDILEDGYYKPVGLLTAFNYDVLTSLKELIPIATTGYILYNTLDFTKKTGVLHAYYLDSKLGTRHESNSDVYKVLRIYYYDDYFKVPVQGDAIIYNERQVNVVDIGIKYEMLPSYLLNVFKPQSALLDDYAKTILKGKNKNKNGFNKKFKSILSPLVSKSVKNSSNKKDMPILEYALGSTDTYNCYTGYSMEGLKGILGSSQHISGEQDHPIYTDMISYLCKQANYMGGHFFNGNGDIKYSNDVLSYTHLVFEMLLKKYVDIDAYYIQSKKGNSITNSICAVNNYHRVIAYLNTCRCNIYDFNEGEKEVNEQFLYPKVTEFGNHTPYSFIFLENMHFEVPEDLKKYMLDDSLTFAFKGLNMENAYNYITNQLYAIGMYEKDINFKGSLVF